MEQALNELLSSDAVQRLIAMAVKDFALLGTVAVIVSFVGCLLLLAGGVCLFMGTDLAHEILFILGAMIMVMAAILALIYFYEHGLFVSDPEAYILRGRT